MRLPFVRQVEIKDCAAACLSMIIKYHHGYLDMEYLKERLLISKKGTSAYDLINLAKEIGFDSYGVKCESKINLKEISLPAIAHVRVNNSYEHYVVIYKVDLIKELIVIGDPAKGIIKMSIFEFEKIWTKVVLVFIPIKNIPILKETSLIDFIFNYFKENKSIVINIFFYSLISTILLIIGAWYLQLMLSAISLINAKEHIVFLTLVFGIVYLFKCTNDYLKNRLLIYFSAKVDTNLTLNSIRNLIYLPYHYYHNHTTGELVMKINDLNIIKNFIIKVSVVLFVNLLLSIITLIILFSISMQLSLIAILSVFTYLILLLIYKKTLSNKIHTVLQSKSDVNSLLVEALAGYQTIKGLAIEENMINKVNKQYHQLVNNNCDLERVYNHQTYIKEIVFNFTYLVFVMFGIISIINNQITLGLFLTFSILFNHFITPIKELIDMDINIEEASSAYQRIKSLFVTDSNPIKQVAAFGVIKFNHLDYRYHYDELVLKNITLTIRQGEKIIITGPSGSGKSTLLKLMMNYYQVNRHMLMIDAYDINDIKEDSIKNNITYVSQKEMLFTDTFFNNLKLYRNIEDDKVLDIIKLCRVEKILGRNTLIEENGFNLSGGERQRLVIARALLNNFKILIIDEGFSEMDISLERIILKNIFDSYKSKTIIVVSHRLDNKDLFDRVIEFSKGMIIKDVSN